MRKISIKFTRQLNKNKTVIIISGTPGSGKTTIASILYRFFAADFQVKIVSITSFHLFSYVLAYTLAKITFRSKYFDTLIIGRIHPMTLLSRKTLISMRRLLLVTEIISLYTVYAVRLFLPLKLRYRVIIVDDGIVNTLGSYIALFKDSQSLNSTLRTLISVNLVLLEKLSQICNVKIFFIDADNETIVQRWQKRKTPPNLKPPFTYSNYMSYLSNVREAKKLLEKLAGPEIIDISTSNRTMAQTSRDVKTTILHGR